METLNDHHDAITTTNDSPSNQSLDSYVLFNFPPPIIPQNFGPKSQFHNDNVHAIHHHSAGGVPATRRLHRPAHRPRQRGWLLNTPLVPAHPKQKESPRVQLIANTWRPAFRDQRDLHGSQAASSAPSALDLWPRLDRPLWVLSILPHF